jgi:hypothetical protein
VSYQDFLIQVAAALALFAMGTLLFAICLGVLFPGFMTTGDSLIAGIACGVLLNIAAFGVRNP